LSAVNGDGSIASAREIASRIAARAGAPRTAKKEYFSALPGRPDHRWPPVVRLNVAESDVPSQSYSLILPGYDKSRSIQSAAKSACLRMMSGLFASVLFAPLPQAGMRRTGELHTSNVLPLAAETRFHEHDP